MQQKEVIYIGIDESNHGRYPEIFVAVFSNNYDNAYIIPQAPAHLLMPKIRSSSTNPLEKITREMDYSFLIWNKDVSREHKRNNIEDKNPKFLGELYASLINGKIQNIQEGGLIEDICLYLDGEKNDSEKKYIKQYSAKVAGIPEQKIHLNDGGDLDRRCKIVNLADSIAYYLHRRIAENKQINANVLLHKKQLLLFD